MIELHLDLDLHLVYYKKLTFYLLNIFIGNNLNFVGNLVYLLISYRT